VTALIPSIMELSCFISRCRRRRDPNRTPVQR
jgi:hypothetical protein